MYCRKIREIFGDDIPIVIGGLEASLRRFAHYDYWSNRIIPSVLIDSGADILSYGMGEKSVARIAELLDRGVPIRKIRDVRGTCFVGEKGDKVHFEIAGCSDYSEVLKSRQAYAEAYKIQYLNQDSISG